MRKHVKMLGGILLVSGTTVGAGMLALPIGTGMAGFFPSLIMLFVYWIFMSFTALLMLEVNLWVGEGNNLITMAKVTLGRWGQVVSWIVYLFLLYLLTTAYLAGSAPLMLDVVSALTGVTLPEWVGTLPLLIIFGYFVYKGARYVDLINRFLMGCLVGAYIVLIASLMPHIDLSLLAHVDWRYSLMGLSIVSVSFGFHIVIPSLVTYLQGDVPRLRAAILIGSGIPLVVYILWEVVTLGIIPIEGKYGIYNGYLAGTNGATLLADMLQQSTLSLITQFFLFFAIVTSFLGVSLSLFDFLADGLNIKKSRQGRCLLYLLTFIPPLLITLIDPRAFLSALEYAGAFGVVILLGLLPAVMAWAGRYIHYLVAPHGYEAPGGKPALIVTIIFSLGVIGYELALKAGWILKWIP